MTEKNYNPEQRTMKNMKKSESAAKVKKEKAPKKEVKTEEKKLEEVAVKDADKETKTEVKEEKKEEVKEKQKPIVKKQQVKKDFAVVNSYNLPISTKKSAAVCRFIKGKTIDKAMEDLELVVKMKKAVPMKGEIPHRKGRGMMSGGFPQNTAKEFIVLLKALSGNSNVNGLDNPVIVEAVPNMASRPFGRFGSWRRKRTHVKLVAREKKEKKK